MKRLYKPLWAALAVATGAAVAGHAGQSTPPIRKTPPPATTPLPAPTIWAWGKAAHGLQGGLRLRNADGRVGSGTLVILEVAARNATRTPIAVEYDDPNEAGSNSSINFIPKGAITRVGIGSDGLGLSAPLTRVLKPGQAVTIRELRFQTYGLPHHTPELALPQWIVSPGKHPLLHSFPIRKKSNGKVLPPVWLTTGTITLIR